MYMNILHLMTVADVVDILQTPAFLCRQTDFIIKVASTDKPVNIKKGQFMSPDEMQFFSEKLIPQGIRTFIYVKEGTCLVIIT